MRWFDFGVTARCVGFQPGAATLQMRTRSPAASTGRVPALSWGQHTHAEWALWPAPRVEMRETGPEAALRHYHVPVPWHGGYMHWAGGYGLGFSLEMARGGCSA